MTSERQEDERHLLRPPYYERLAWARETAADSTVSDEERLYASAVLQRLDWEVAALRAKVWRQRELRRAIRDAVPNALGTLMAAAVIYLVGVAAGYFEGKGVAFTATGVLVAGVTARYIIFDSLGEPSHKGLPSRKELARLQREAREAESARTGQEPRA